MVQIIKRNKSKESFDRNKIISAMSKAYIEVDGQLFEDDTVNEIADEIYEDIKNKKEIEVEEIQDRVEKALMDTTRKDVARAYVRYRYKREVAREKSDDFKKAIIEKLEAKNIEMQNANVDELSFGGRVGSASDVATKQLALEEIISEMARKNHENNEIYIHDLSSYYVGSHNCLSIPFDDLLARGFNTRQTDVRPANSVSTAFQLVAVIFQLQSLMQFGGVAATHLDWTMVPYVRKSFYKHYCNGLKYLCDWSDDACEGMKLRLLEENCSINNVEFLTRSGIGHKPYKYALDLTQKEVEQAAEGMFHNLNTLQSRSGNQLPFTSINFGTCTEPEGRMITKALLNKSIDGVGKLHKTAIFPCTIFQLGKGINREPGDPNYDLFQLALKSTAQRLYPNYANIDWSGNTGYDPNNPVTFFSTMGCRTANGWDINGLGQQKDGRGNICPVTIILPTLAMEAKQNFMSKNILEKENLKEIFIIEEFMQLLDKKIYEAKDMLIERFNWICSQDPASAKFMYENNVMAGYIPEEGIRSALKHGTLAIGQIALAETLQILIGKNHTNPEGMKLAKRIEQLFKDRCAQFKEEYKLNFGVYMTPAESLCYTAMKKFKAKYGEIPNVSDREFFTNSIHIPVWEQIGLFEKIDLEAELTGYSSAGCITYIELDSGVKNNISALERIVNYAMDKDIPYFAVNIPNDTCLECGYTDEFNDTCPQCGSHNIQHLRRVTGYLTGNYTTAFNLGKQAEVQARVKHMRFNK